MHDLDQRIESWRAELQAFGCKSTLVDEAVDHLCSVFEEELQHDCESEDAWARASERFGPLDQFVQESRKESPIMHPTSRLLGGAVVLGAIALAVNTTSPGVFLHLPALLFVCGVVVGGLLAAFGPHTIIAAVRTSLGRVALPEQRALHALVFRRAGQLAWAAGGLGMIFGMIGTLANLADPKQIGSAAALCLLSVLYGGLIAELVFRTGAQWIENQELAVNAN